MQDWTDAALPLFIDGDFIGPEGRSTFGTVDPATGTVVQEVVLGTADDVDAAVKAGKRALKGPWGTMPMTERLALLDKVADGIDARADAFLHAEMMDTGKPIRMARAIDIPRGAANFRVFAEMARTLGTESYMTDRPGARALNTVLRQPVGVVGVISPWNLPLLLMTWKVAPALAMGNAVVVKASEETPTTALLLAEVMKDVGVPDGVYNVVHGFGPESVGEALTMHPGIDALTFTGESNTGTAIMKAAAPGLKHLSFELGGKNPAIVFADADIDKAVAGTTKSVFTNCGQVCLCSERVYVHRSIFDTFVEKLKASAERLVLGDPFDPATDMGPLISQTHREKVLGYFELAKELGATVVTGGGVPRLGDPWWGGFFVEPTILTGLPEDSRIQKEEIFGPVCHITPFDDEDEVLAMANDTEYGLCAAVWTSDLGRANRMAAGLEAGIVWVNTWFLRDLRTPFGGRGRSGFGREGGIHSLNFYSELKTVCTNLD